MYGDFDPYDHLMDLTKLQHELAREVNNQSTTIEQLIHHIQVQESRIKSMNARLLSAENRIKELAQQ